MSEEDRIQKRLPPVLRGLELMREDWEFLVQRVQRRSDRDELLGWYRKRWLSASALEPAEHRKANAGRRAANLMILRALEARPRA